MKFRFQSFVDVSTSASSMQVIQWSVGGMEVVNRCRHLFGAYKYFKLGRISIKLVPASTLPVDPLGLSYSTSDPQTVDPRDQMNPGLVRITNGEDIKINVSSLTDVQQEACYNAMMLDPRWSKFMLQSGFRRSAYPLYWQVGQLAQDKYPGATVNFPDTSASYDVTAVRSNYVSGTGVVDHPNGGSSARGLFQVGHRGRLGFLPTDCFQQVPAADGTYTTKVGINNVPEVSVITCVLPKAFKTVYYYRCYITEEVIFTGLRAAPYSTGGFLYNGLDQFLYTALTASSPPTAGANFITDQLMNNGGNLP